MAKPKTTTKYMHLLDGRPAFFDGTQVVYAGYRADARKMFVDSLTVIRRQQADSLRQRERWGFDSGAQLSYLVVRNVGAATPATGE